ncbi:unnamed protein product [Amoebophrya sp. A120]|nr:unnamed protein product [Amoebophrya sp. A120]|eukprot:GSA120T00021505001.1
MAVKDSPSSIYVAIRVRPFVPREKKAKEGTCLECRHPEIKLINTTSGSVQSFELDEIWDSSCDPTSPLFFDQEKVYRKMGMHILGELRDGYNCALFAYGQTGSGKTTSIMGDMNPEKERGILPRLLYDLFAFYDGKQKLGWKVDVRVRMLEIYNERIQDLLRPSNEKVSKKLDVRMHPKLGVYVPDLTINAVESAEDCIHLLEYGVTMKTVAATQMNAQSSRAHTIFAMKIEKDIKEGYGERHESSELFIVDLAGRENERTTLATGERLVELSFINKSLFHLANCIHALGSAQQASSASGKSTKPGGQHAKVASTQRDISQANFRNSKLTLLLSEALSGNSKTYMIGTLSPAVSAFEENQVTLRFAATVKNIKLKASKIEASKTDQVSALNDELIRLREQLANAPAGGKVDGELREQLDATNAALAEKQRSWEDAKKEAERNAEDRNKMLKKLGVQKMKYQQQLDRMKEKYAKPLPYISNEAADPHLSGRIEYSFDLKRAKNQLKGSWFFGSDYDALVKTAKEFDIAPEAKLARSSDRSSAGGEEVDNCVEISGLGISAKLCRFDVTGTPPASKSKETSNRNELENSDLDDKTGTTTTTGSRFGGRAYPSALEVDEVAIMEKPEDIRGSFSLQKQESHTLTVTRLSSDGQVMVNNETLEVGKPHALLQGDKVILGRAYIFRCYVDSAEDDKELHERGSTGLVTPRHRRSKYNSQASLEKCIRDLLGGETLADNTEIFLAKSYLAQLRSLSIDNEPRVYSFLYEAKKTKHLVDEANEITTAVRPQDNLKFELDTSSPLLFTGYATSHYMPQLMVRVVRMLTPAQKKWGAIRHRIHFAKGHILQQSHLQEYDEEIHKHPENHPVQDCEVLFVWSITKFLGRLDMMRDIYHNWMSGVSFFVDLKEDPWVEAGPVEMEFWMREKEEEKLMEIEQLKKEIVGYKEKAKQAKTDRDESEKKRVKLERELALKKQEEIEENKISNAAGQMSEMQLLKENAKVKAQVATLQEELTKLKLDQATKEKQNASNSKQSAEQEKKLKQQQQQFVEEKQKMLDRFKSEKDSLKEELEKRLSDLKKKDAVEKDAFMKNAENDKMELRKAFEEEKNSMRRQFKEDLENIRQMEQQEMESKYQQHEQQIATLNELLAEALAKSGNA